MTNAAIEFRRIKVGEVTLHTALCGAELSQNGSTPLLLLHGFPEFWHTWKETLMHFGPHRAVCAPDLRGYNLSDKPVSVEGYSIEKLVGDVFGLVAALGWKKVILVGHDWGGVVAWITAMAKPAWLERLVIVNAPHPATFARELAQNPAQRQASAYMADFQKDDAADRLLANGCARLASMFFDSSRKPYSMEQKDAYLDAWQKPGAAEAMINWYRAAALAKKTEAALPVVAVPTEVVWGQDDVFLLPGNTQGLDAFVSDLRVTPLPGVTHWVAHEAKEALWARIAGIEIEKGAR